MFSPTIYTICGLVGVGAIKKAFKMVGLNAFFC